VAEGLVAALRPARHTYPSEFPQRLHRVNHMLQHLMRVHDVESVIGQIKRVHIGDHDDIFCW
jgi:hypothetical protein